MSRWIDRIGKIVAAVAAFGLFFQIAPWINSRSIEHLPGHVSAPEWAQSFHIERGGDYVFQEFGTVAEEPVRATALIGSLVLLLAYLFAGEWRRKHHRTAEE